MAEEWSDWISHDGGLCPVPPSCFVHVRGFVEKGVFWEFVGRADDMIWENVNAYAVRRPPAVRLLVDLAEGLPVRGREDA